MAIVDYYTYIKPLISEPECGDISIMLDSDDVFFAALLDVLGHGKEARQLALKSIDVIEGNYSDNLNEIVEVLHKKIKNSRGLVGSFIRIDKKTGNLTFLGIGNVTSIIIGKENHRFVNKQGIIGQNISNPRIEEVKLKDKDLVLLYSDGIPEKITIDKNIPLYSRHPKIIASEIVDSYGKNNDDSACFVLRFTTQN